MSKISIRRGLKIKRGVSQKILRIDLTTRTTQKEPMVPKDSENFLGGRALVAMFLYRGGSKIL